MASTNHTTNYNLPQWEATDAFCRTDFNAAFSDIDSALNNLANIAIVLMTGTYIGNGEASQFINLGRTPKAVLIMRYGNSVDDNSSHYGGIAVTGHPSDIVSITTNGFLAMQSDSWNFGNADGYSYTYIALC